MVDADDGPALGRRRRVMLNPGRLSDVCDEEMTDAKVS
jgi:hypothetical protein